MSIEENRAATMGGFEPQLSAGTLRCAALGKEAMMKARRHPQAYAPRLDRYENHSRGRVPAAVVVTVLAVATLTAGALPAFAGEEVAQAWQLDLIAGHAIVGEEVVEALATEGSARVIATFDVRSRYSGRLHGRFATAAARAALGEVSDEILSGVPEDSFRIRYRYQAVNALAGEVDAAGVLALLDHPAVRAIDVDGRATASLAEAIPLARIDRVKNMTTAEGKKLRGRGVTVAVIDSGADLEHPDIKKRIRAGECFCSGNCCPDGSSRQSGKAAAMDDNGHGTHVTGIIVSKGRLAPKGAAPKAKIVAIKTLDSEGSAFTSDNIAALNWIITERPDVDIVNMSFGGTDRLYQGNCDQKDAATEAFATAIDTLWDRGVMAFAASGNESHHKKMALPACIERVVSVGSTYDAELVDSACPDLEASPDQVVCDSNSSKTTDIVAPGCEILSSYPEESAALICGTSMASPLTAGCTALLKQAFPKATPALLESALVSSSTIVTDPKNDRGYPALDCEEAFEFLDRSIASESVAAVVPAPRVPGPSTPELPGRDEGPEPGVAGIDPSSPLSDTVDRERPRRRKE